MHIIGSKKHLKTWNAKMLTKLEQSLGLPEVFGILPEALAGVQDGACKATVEADVRHRPDPSGRRAPF